VRGSSGPAVIVDTIPTSVSVGGREARGTRRGVGDDELDRDHAPQQRQHWRERVRAELAQVGVQAASPRNGQHHTAHDRAEAALDGQRRRPATAHGHADRERPDQQAR